MSTRRTWFSRLQLLALIAAAAIVFPPLQIHGADLADASASPLTIEGLGKGVAPLDGPWQFHLGDNPAWAAPGVDDATGHNGWEQLTADAPWGTQGHASYTGYAWYRRQINITPAPGVSPDVTLLIPAIDDVYELLLERGFCRPSGHLSATYGLAKSDTAAKLQLRASRQRRPRRAGLQSSSDVNR